MNKKTLTNTETLTIGLMLFALFLGAGNLIFPPYLGQLAGEQLLPAIIGFLLTGVGLPLLGILAIAKAGGDLQSIAGRVHPVFGIVFTMIVYLAIGPFFGIPRTATVAFEIGTAPFLSAEMASSFWSLFLFTIIFFVITVLFALNPTKLVDRIGKILTPILIVVIGFLAVKSFLTPMGPISAPVGNYDTEAFFESFLQGYLTMDAIAALVFGIVIIQSIRAKGVEDKNTILKTTAYAGFIAAAGLSLVYLSLSYIGATSVEAIGMQDNGGEVIALASRVLYGEIGGIILATAITFACLTTSIGLVSATAQFFNKIFPQLPYVVYVFIFAGFSTIIANVGLTQLIAISLPVLLAIYPLAIVLVILSFFDHFFYQKSYVYIIPLVLTGIVSVFDALKSSGFEFNAITQIFSYLPFYEQGIGWLVPAIIGTLIGIFIARSTHKK
ncbi:MULTISPECIES: branched-chain amino acid transport system II carrier protein [unclassified Planococcus (in: firmicutes)]|uniref:branched-chain amino acid transport system II carrier protein n=1 Tax=unclassified Planococcus (in: firmicutes) TaxID=2662419 RepID=UPI000C34D99C|nr:MULTISPECIES: branched-chain amino acid transport system II carrier protein [unclassified Planococcus (in: firmicutes)]AUD14305.1 branched-chain amino acid transport system II carrier protein [Planococcus sp. MB-3u-03]PKG48351.1 branched-chain amino acid transport system II carrier protein [Planococcus sp. Urea-trap-24]PKG92198.1 branched-chain amino acid transport system II carrier protein [Planococcus sp. Urea-3u-39]PKH42896.1 branched-chain amino acid transport system II carrier protein [